MTMFAMKESQKSKRLQAAIDSLKMGGVIAYPTESCFGLGCDPKNQAAIQKVINIKSRSESKGLILIAATIEQTAEYVDLDKSPLKSHILDSWPGSNTWLLPAKDSVLPILKGDFPLLAIRVTKHPIASQLCQQFGGAIVSTSANFSGHDALKNSAAVEHAFAGQIDMVLDGMIGDDIKPSTIRDGLTGQILRP